MAAPLMTAPIDCICMACDSGLCDFKPVRFQRRAVGDNDVLIDMKYCGVCHSDVMWLKGESALLLGKPHFPHASPGHELAGIVAEVGKNVKKFKVGDQIGVGCMVDSCMTCKKCKEGSENQCTKGSIWTYGSPDKYGRAGMPAGEVQTKGGYCNKFVVNEHFGIKIPDKYPLEAAGPIMCAGITVYDPMRQHNVGQGSRVGVAGLGGLGITAIKIAKVLGAKVTAISRNEAKKQLALDNGADNYIATANQDQLEDETGSLDLIINTIPSNHDYRVYSPLLAKDGKMVLLGLTNAMVAAFIMKNISKSCPIDMSGIGGIAATQEIIDLAAEHNIIPYTKIVPVDELNKIFEECDAGNDAGIRYVLDIGNTLTEQHLETISCGPAPKLGHTQGFNFTGIVGEFGSMLFGQTMCRKRKPA